ncbi:hypothetical protein F9C07_13309 [Aspergillus flavus]|uniref:Uncharacterized protein n=1 Tax=Aspergillus flavus (strain ATCC 200026 / FGSC A1120 / IAM 13836 / NRRL 3357 / JCM 12722 / SRRC 167) TaxID=332952 RepID=A0A7U2MZV2_ASPFN|nr:hypothetical protein F9C07_13309 [Aspergillus flavus]
MDGVRWSRSGGGNTITVWIWGHPSPTPTPTPPDQFVGGRVAYWFNYLNIPFPHPQVSPLLFVPLDEKGPLHS